MTSVNLSDEQQAVLDACLLWAKDAFTKRVPSVAALAGYAGTGKTTVLIEFARNLKVIDPDVIVGFAAFTGKASSVLRSKMLNASIPLGRNAHVGTLHSMAYTLVDSDSGGPRFVLNQTLTPPQSERPLDILVLDEASMITDEVLADLKKYNIPILLVGDPGQLPPVTGDTVRELLNTNCRLEKIHRQAEDNPILTLAHSVRNGAGLRAGVTGTSLAVLSKTNKVCKEALSRFCSRFSEEGAHEQAILSAVNKQRIALNRAVRTKSGFSTATPDVGERLVGLRNNREAGVINGELYVVTGAVQMLNSDKIHRSTEQALSELYAVKIEDPISGRKYPRMAAHTGFLGSQDARYLDSYLYKNKTLYEALAFRHFGCSVVAQFDFGYALTVHKAQGSEWERVVLYNYRHASWTDADYARWLYTAITRAKEKLLIVV